MSIPDGTRAPRYAALVAILTLAMLGSAMALNVVVDPRDQFPGHFTTPLRSDPLAEKVAAYDQHGPVDTIVFGSSRSMVLAPEGSRFNFALSRGRAYDALLLWQMLESRNETPERVILGVDVNIIENGPFTFNRGSPAFAALEGRRMDVPDYSLNAVKSLDMRYEVETAKVLWMTFVSGYPPPISATGVDGVVSYPRFDAERQAGTFDLETVLPGHFDGTVHPHYTPGSYADPRKTVLLDQLVAGAAASGARIQVLLPPFHPYALERLQEDPVFEAQQEAALDLGRSWCPLGIELYDFTDVASFGGEPDAFYDNFHFTPETAALVMAALDAHRGDLCAEGAAAVTP